MSRRAFAITLCIPILLTATVLALPDGQPDVVGIWDATVKIKSFATDPADQGEKFKVKMPVTFTQNGADLTMTVSPPGEMSFDMTGEMGDGHFWISGETEGGRPRMAVGHVAGNGKKIKAIWLEAWNDEVAEIKISAKRRK